MYTFDKKKWILFKLSKKNKNHANGMDSYEYDQ